MASRSAVSFMTAEANRSWSAAVLADRRSYSPVRRCRASSGTLEVVATSAERVPVGLSGGGREEGGAAAGGGDATINSGEGRAWTGGGGGAGEATTISGEGWAYTGAGGGGDGWATAGRCAGAGAGTGRGAGAGGAAGGGGKKLAASSASRSGTISILGRPNMPWREQGVQPGPLRPPTPPCVFFAQTTCPDVGQRVPTG